MKVLEGRRKMRNLAFALVGSAVLLIGVAATTSAHKPGAPEPPEAGAIFAGTVGCSDFGSGAQLFIDAGMEGGVLGIPSNPYFRLSFRPSGTCDAAIAALTAQIPSPLCSTGTSGIQPGFAFVCSGGSRSVVEAVGGLAKSAVSL